MFRLPPLYGAWSDAVISRPRLLEQIKCQYFLQSFLFVLLAVLQFPAAPVYHNYTAYTPNLTPEIAAIYHTVAGTE